MSMRTTLRRTVVSAAIVAAAALPFQAGAAHADTPNDGLSTCIDGASTTYRAALMSGTDFDVASAVDDCVNAYLVDIGIDPATGMVENPDPSTVINAGILGTIDDGSTADADAGAGAGAA